jgi:hypothetical protein
MKIKVKMLDSIAGLADPKSTETLDAKYKTMIDGMKARKPKAVPDTVMEETIAQTKLRDRYGETPLGFPRDWSFRPGEEVLIDAELARKWEAAGICVLVEAKAA